MQVIYPELKKLIADKSPSLEAISADEKQALLVYKFGDFKEFNYDDRYGSILCWHDRDYGDVLAYTPLSVWHWNKVNWGHDERTINELFETGIWDLSTLPENFPLIESQKPQLDNLKNFIGRGFLVGIDPSSRETPTILISQFADQVYKNRLHYRSIQWSCPNERTGLMLLNEVLGLFTHYTYGYGSKQESNRDNGELNQTETLEAIEFAYAIDRMLRNAQNAYIGFANDDYVLISDGTEVRWTSKAIPYAHSAYAYDFTPDVIVVDGEEQSRQEWMRNRMQTLPTKQLEEPLEDFMKFMLDVNCLNLGRLFTPSSYTSASISAKLEKSGNEITFEFEHITTSGTEVALYSNTHANTHDVIISIPVDRALPDRCHYSCLTKFMMDNEISLSEAGVEVIFNNMVGYIPPLLEPQQSQSSMELVE